MAVILASQSPRRQELLQRVIAEFQTCPASIDERVPQGMSPVEYVALMAQQKAATVASDYPQDLVIGCDTIVTIDRKILGKPENETDALQMLQMLSGRKHEVYTSFALQKEGHVQVETVCSEVTFYSLDTQAIQDYLATGEYADKAGAYGIQGHGALLIESIQGDYYAIVGLPIAKLNQVLQTGDWLKA